MAIHIALTLALLGSLAMAGVLLFWSDRVAGARLLVAFLVGVAVWILGNELPSWAGPRAEPLALMLLATAALTSAAFLHFCIAFCIAFCRAPVAPRWIAPRWIAAGYAVGAAATLLSVVLVPGGFEPFAGLRFVAIPNTVGWITSLVWALLAGAGQLVLLRTLREVRGLERRQIAAVTASSAWGLLCMSGYAVAALRLPFYPYPLLGLPLYPAILVYGVLRYRVLVANAWARRALVWALLVGAAGLIVGTVPLLPFENAAGTRWLTGAAVGVAFLVMGGPVRRLAERLVYPGGTVVAGDLAEWRGRLARAQTRDEMADTAADILSRRLALEVDVAIGTARPGAGHPLLLCTEDGNGWHAALLGWDAASPGPRRVAELMGALLAEELPRLARAAQMAERERAAQTQARLAELGALAAAVAHDVRNPLNIIGMAVAMAEPDMRGEVRDQVRRIARLADELLDYAKPWRIDAVPLDLAAWAGTARVCAGVETEPGRAGAMWALADPARLEQAVGNLLDNARAVAGRIGIEAEAAEGGVMLHVFDDGPGLPPDLRERVFQPFVSRSPGGTGLGLAIVARIMTAHGGSAALTERPGWSTCFTLTFPAVP